MVPNLLLKLTQICSILLIAIALSSEGHIEKPKETKLYFFLQDIAYGPNATEVVVAGIPGTQWGYFQFGSVFVLDEPLTEGIEQNSTEIGRAQGLNVIASKDASNAFFAFTLIFTNKKYNGSTLSVQVAASQSATMAELAVNSGTGKFRFARGYAIFQLLQFDPATGHSVTLVNITLKHY